MISLTVVLGVFLALTTFAQPLTAGIIPGAALDFDAARDDNNNDRWENIGSAQQFTFEFSAPKSPIDVSDPTLQALSKAFNSPAALFKGSIDAQLASFRAIDESVPNDDATFELVIRIPDFEDTHVLVETGGDGNGTSIVLRNEQLVFRAQQHNSDPMRNAEVSIGLLPTDLNRFIHLVGVIDVGDNTASIYKDCIFAASAGTFETADPVVTADLTEWVGGGPAALGRPNTAGGIAGGDLGFTDFDGDIAVFRFYGNQAFTAAEVAENYMALVPEPSSIELAALVVLVVAIIGRRHSSYSGIKCESKP